MKKKSQGKLGGSILGTLIQARIVVLTSNWIFQGMRYMNYYELGLKLTLDALVIWLLLVFVWGTDDFRVIIYSVIIAHTFNWIMNGHFFVLMRYIYPFPTKIERFYSYADEMKIRGKKLDKIQGMAIYGSFCRNKLHGGSDLDVRVVVDDDLLSGMVGAIYCSLERFHAFFAGFPLDIYCCSGTGCLDKLRDDEIPKVLIDRRGELARRYSKKSAYGE